MLVQHHRKAGHDDGNHAHEFDEDVQGRAGSVFEGITNCVTHDGGVVIERVLTSEMAVLDIFLGVVPSTAGIS